MAAPYSPFWRSSAPRWNKVSGVSAKARAGSKPRPRRAAAKTIAGLRLALGRRMAIHALPAACGDESPGSRPEILRRALAARIEADALARRERLAGATAERPVEAPPFELS